MELVNADNGIHLVPAQPEKRRWYRLPQFPLVPMFEYTPGNEWNSPDFVFAWLLLHVWTLMTPQLAFGFEASDSGIHLSIHLPYLKIVFWLLPFPVAIHRWSYKHFWRTGRHQ